MEDLIKSLKKQGWNLSEEKLEGEFQDEENGEAEKKKFLRDAEKWLLDQDLKAIGSPFLPEGINSGKISQLSCPVILQVKEVDIVSAPQMNTDSQAAPRMLKIGLTDGKTTCYGIEFEHVPRLSMKTPPGTKVKLTNNMKLSHGFLLLDNRNVQVLGGEVPHLMDEWRIQQSLIGYVRAANLENGPPPWVPFGHRVRADHIVETKALKEPEVEKEEKDEEFLNQRQDAIAAAAHSGQKKVFRGSGKQIEIQQPERGRGRGRGEGGRRGRDRESREEMAAATRPRDSIRLFEFLQPQIGADGTHQDQDQEQDEDLEIEESNGYGRNSGRGRGHSRSGRGSFGDREGSYGDRGGRGGYGDRDRSYGRGGGGGYGDREGSFGGRGGRAGHEDREGSYGRGGRGGYGDREGSNSRGGRGRYDDREGSYSRGGRGGYGDREGSYSRGGRGGYDDREGSYGRGGRGGYGDREGSYGRGRRGGYGDREGSFDRGGRRGYGDREGSYGRGRSHGDRGRGQRGGSYRDRGGDRDYYSSSSHDPVDTLVDDFSAWPGLGGQDPDPVPRPQPANDRSQQQWQIDDYCLAKWDSAKDYPAVIQGLSADGQSATVMFVETGAFRTVDIRNLKSDPGDSQQPKRNTSSHSNQVGRVNTRRPGRARY